jgi:hypothetical protein
MTTTDELQIVDETHDIDTPKKGILLKLFDGMNLTNVDGPILEFFFVIYKAAR